MTELRIVALLASLALAACGPSQNQAGSASPPASSSGAAGKSARPQTVTSILTRTESIPLILEAQGNVIAQDEVELRAQKTGTVSRIHFREGEEVRAGQLLFALDSRDDQANLDKALARVAGSRAQLEIARRDWVRAQDLADRHFISQSGLDAARSRLDAAESTLAQEIAALESARVQLSYNTIRAPFAGRAGRVDVRSGSLVQANSSAPLVKITRLDPVAVSFTLPESALPAVQAAQASARVSVTASDGSLVHGRIVFIESSIDATAGTIAIKARFDNDRRLLWPGQFVAVRVQAGEIRDAVTLPAQAIQNGPKGQFVYVIGADQTVLAQPVKVAQIYRERAVVTGVDADVRVVLEGGQNLRPGGRVAEAAPVPAGARRASQASAARD